jgi:hypothetical protein
LLDRLADSGAGGILMHPGIVFSMNAAVQFFMLVSLPLRSSGTPLSTANDSGLSRESSGS